LVTVNILNLPFKEQVDYFRRKVPTPVKSLRRIGSAYHDHAFSVSQVTRSDYLGVLFDWLLRSIESGTDYQTSILELEKEKEGRRVMDFLGNKQLETVFDTNVRRAHTAGRIQQYEKPEIKALFPYRQWLHRDSPKFRPHHKALDLKVFRADEEFWKYAMPPCAFGCRCGFRHLSERMVIERGLTVEKPPDWRTIVEPPFDRSPNPKNYHERAIDRAPVELQENLRKDLESRG
jgi:SPP1 gp7 family putative phage head morphogenesis protein